MSGRLDIPIHTPFTWALQSGKSHADPLGDDVRFVFTGPEDRERIVEAYWDGGQTWRVAFSPDSVGSWRWRCDSSDTLDPGLAGQSGDFECIPHQREDDLAVHGPIVAPRGLRHFTHADGTPWLYLADTAWNGAMRSEYAEWDAYLRTRADQGFSAVQFVVTPWRGCQPEHAGGRWAFDVREGKLIVNPPFFQRLDTRIGQTVQAGLVPVPVMLWAHTDSDPGLALGEQECIRLGRWLVARWSAWPVIWLLLGDAQLDSPERIERYRRIGRGVFDQGGDRPVGIHPVGLASYAQELGDEPWLDFIGYQSGHGAGEDDLRFQLTGPMAGEWQSGRAMPHLDLEPNYEGHPIYGTETVHDAFAVRRATWWSLLRIPTAGVTYGCNPVWIWPEGGKPGPAIGHEYLDAFGPVPPWSQGAELPGGEQFGRVGSILQRIDWWTLTPADDWLAHQPGESDLQAFTAVAANRAGDGGIAYLPRGGEIVLSDHAGGAMQLACWADPRTGEVQRAEVADGCRLHAPDDRDWVLLLGVAAR